MIESDVAAVRDMLKHLDDPVRLRANALVATIVAATAGGVSSPNAIARRVRSVVTQALGLLLPAVEGRSTSATYARRLHAIIARCDLGGELHANVARDLNICKQQFYRDRRRALAQLDEAIRSLCTGPASATVHEQIDDVRLQLDLARQLRNVGQFAGARRVLDRLAGQMLAPVQRALVLHRLTDVLCELQAFPEAQDVVTRAKYEMLALPDGTPERALIEAETLTAEIRVLAEVGHAEQARRIAEHAIAFLATTNSLGTPRGHSLFVELSILLAEAHCEGGAFERAIPVVEAARMVSDDSIDPALAIGLHFCNATAYFALPWGVGQASLENGAAFRLACDGGLVRSEATALANLCAIHFVRGEYSEALRCGRSALSVIDQLAPPLDSAMLQLNIARAEIALENEPRALELLGSAKSLVAAGTPASALIEVAEAEAHMIGGRFEKAALVARHAQTAFEQHGVRKRIGIALRAQAEAYAKLGKRRAARAMIRDAIDAAEGAGTAYSLADVYRTSAMITGNRRHAGYAADLRSALRG